MNRIVTRGMGVNHLLVTRGYGRSRFVQRIHEVLRLISKISRDLLRVSKWKKTDCV